MSEPTQPLDPGVEADGDPAARSRPAHLSLSSISLVVAGGVAGTGLRYLVNILTPAWAAVLVGTLAINVTGAFLLAVLLERLTQQSLGGTVSRRARLGVGTGFLGGFTTYSALATDTLLLVSVHPGRAAAYALTTVILGGAASLLGIWVGRRSRPSAAPVEG